MRRAFPLDMIEVATPCHASWDAMMGDDRSRFCGECQRHVYNLSGMTRAEAETLIREKEGKLCVRFYRRADRKLMTADCPVGLAALRRKTVRLAGVVVGAVVGLIGAFFVVPALFGENRGSATLRSVKPFSAVLNYFDPQPTCVMGAPLPSTPGNGGVGPQQPNPPADEPPEQKQ
jgi:hypothetical protein